MEELIVGIFVTLIGGLILYYIFGIGKEKRAFSSRYSSTQYIKVLPPSLGGIDHLNLDNEAILQLHVPYNNNQITLILNKFPVIELPSKEKEGIKVEGFKIVSHKDAKIYTFSMADNIKKIEIGKRVFIVHLRKISILNVKTIPNAKKYEFGITEE